LAASAPQKKSEASDKFCQYTILHQQLRSTPDVS